MPGQVNQELTKPYSRFVSHVNRPNLVALLNQAEIKYIFLGSELGARPENPNCYVEGKAVYKKMPLWRAFGAASSGLLRDPKIIALP